MLFSRDVGSEGFRSGLWGQVAVLAAAISYAGSSVFARRSFREVPLLFQAAIPLFIADALIWGAAYAFETPLVWPNIPLTWISLAFLGLLGSCVAYLLFFYLLATVGSTRTVLVTYMFPVIGLALGVLFLNEQLDSQLVFGALLVVAGIGVVNWKPKVQQREGHDKSLLGNRNVKTTQTMQK